MYMHAGKILIHIKETKGLGEGRATYMGLCWYKGEGIPVQLGNLLELRVMEKPSHAYFK